jgi:hypothetical protein
MKIAGTAYFKADGKQFTLSGSFSYSVNKNTREGKAGLSGVAGFTETSKVPWVEGEFYTTPEFRTADLEKITNATITVDLANGVTVLLQNAWQTGDIEIDAAAGTSTVRFEGMAGKEI